MKKFLKIFAALLVILVLSVVGFLLFAEHDPDMVVNASKRIEGEFDESAIQSNPNRNAYFGELHLHTTTSLDSNIFGNKMGAREAYRFAKGEEMPIGRTGQTQKITEPLDFAAVTDHAEGLGLMSQCYTKDSGAYWTLDCIGLRYKILPLFPRMVASLKQDGTTLSAYNPVACGFMGKKCKHAAVGVWEDMQSAANEHYQPGKFSTFMGFEYSPTLQNTGMMHRNIIYRGADVPHNVFSASDGFVEDLMRWLDQECTGNCKALSIPHNPNFSWGLMFGDYNSDSRPLRQEDLLLRAKYERLVEVFQAKGSSECASGLMNNDEECAFENIFPVCTPEQEKLNPLNKQHAGRCVSANDMVRTTLRKGLQDEKKWGFNPYQLGLIASTDNHNGLSGDSSEKGYKGHGAPSDSTPEKRLGVESSIVSKTLGFPMAAINPGGLAGVWAERNTRGSIWDALHRRETWGTSGTRVKVRFFGGYDLPADLHTRKDMVPTAYKIAVPMGETLKPSATGQSPSFAVWAVRDIHSAPLQKIQIVKAWVEGDTTQEQVFDVACSDGIEPDPVSHRCADNGAKVNLKDCSISEDKGAAELANTWKDPTFKPEQSAFYYVRVLENPVCRFSQRDAIEKNLPHPAGFAQTIRERAWTSPIWYKAQSSSN